MPFSATPWLLVTQAHVLEGVHHVLRALAGFAVLGKREGRWLGGVRGGGSGICGLLLLLLLNCW